MPRQADTFRRLASPCFLVTKASEMLPLSLLRAAIGHPMVRRASSPPSPHQHLHLLQHYPAGTCPPQLVELKSGETYNGTLEKCDNWMNLNLREVICTSRVRPNTLVHADQDAARSLRAAGWIFQ